MKKKNNCVGLLLAMGLAGNVFAQQLQNWSIPPNQVKFASGSPAPSLLPSSTSTGGYFNHPSAPNEISVVSNSMHDANGNLLFFVTQDLNDYGKLKVFDKNGNVIKDANGNDVLKCDYNYTVWVGASSSSVGVPTPSVSYGHVFSNWAEEINIIQVPGNCNQYYIVAGFQDEHNLSGAIAYQPVYAKLDMSLSTNGQLIAASSTSNLFNLTNQAGMPNGSFQPYAPNHRYRFGIATTPFRQETGNQNHFLYVYGDYSNVSAKGFFKYQVDASGINFVSVETPTVTTFVGGTNNYYSEMEIVRLSSGNYRLAKVIENINIFYCDLDYATGSIIPGTQKTISLATGKSLEGLEFSPDGNHLYYSYHGTVNKIGYLPNLSSGGTPVPTDYLTSQNVGFIEMANDVKIYFNASGNLISKTLPNTPSIGTWNYSATTLSPDYNGEYSALLPDQIDGQVLFATSPTISGNNFACNTTEEVYTLSGAYNPSTYYTWTITGGTPSTYSGTSNTLAINWTSSGGTISVQAGCSPATTFTVNSCCRYFGSVPVGVSLVYLNNKTETIPITYNASNIVVINGLYTINTNSVTYNNCPTYIAPDATVTINSGGNLRLINGTVWQAGCGKMWNGIIENSGANLLVSTSTIRDAKLAIDSKLGAMVSMNGSKLNANYRGILLETYGSTHPATVRSSTISCVDAFGNAANCLIASNYNPVLVASTRRSYTGIEINNVAQANIGDASYSGLTNTFNNMDIGIYNINSGLTVYNNNFTNITYPGGGTAVKGRCIHSTNSTTGAEKRLIVGGAGSYQANSFTDSYLGVLAQYNQDVNVTGNIFNNLAHTGVYTYYCYGTGNVISVLSNTITQCTNYAIYSLGNGGSQLMDVSNNAISMTTKNTNCNGIYISNPGLSTGSTAPVMTILNNTIRDVAAGITVTNFTAPGIRGNTISALSDLGSSIYSRGIFVTNSPSSHIESNLVQGTGYTKWWSDGIRLEPGCTYAKVLCNATEDIGSGLFFAGNCAYTQTARNNMKNNYWGFIRGGDIADQLTNKSNENTWQGTFVNHILNLQVGGTVPTWNMYTTTQSPTIPGPSYYPTSFSNAIGTGSTPMNISTAYAGIPSGYTCVSRSMKVVIPNENSDNSQLLKIAKGEINSPLYEEATKWWANYNLYNIVQADASLQTVNADLKTFADNTSNTNMNKLYSINESLNKEGSDLNGIAELINGLSTESSIEQYLKDVYTVTVANRLNDGLTRSEILKLKSIAKLCPYESGPAVYNARAILSTIDNTLYSNDCEIVRPTAKQMSSNSLISNVNNMVTVVPNPNNGSFILSMDSENEKDILVYDVMGKVVFEKHNTTDRKIAVDITNEAKGIYFVKITTNQDIILKKIINH